MSLPVGHCPIQTVLFEHKICLQEAFSSAYLKGCGENRHPRLISPAVADLAGNTRCKKKQAESWQRPMFQVFGGTMRKKTIYMNKPC